MNGPPAASPLANGRIPSLDGLRAVSIALVMFAHLCGTRFFPVSMRFYAERLGDVGNLGVRVFFVISGFLITSLLLEERGDYGRISLRNFYVRRLIRIFPAAYGLILALWIASALGWIELKEHDLICAVTYTMNYHQHASWYLGHLWSLGVEEQFYLLWPAVLAMTQPRLGLRIVGAVMVVAPVLRYVIPHFAPDLILLVGNGFLANADALGAGCLLAGLWGFLGGSERYRRGQESPAFLLLPIAVFVFNGWHPRESIGFWLISFNNIAIALCIDWAVRHHRGAVGAFLNWRPIAFVGVLSYSLYLWQEPFLNRNMQEAAITSFPLNLAATFAAALLSYYGLERQFQRLRTRFLPHGQRRPASGATSTA